ncbi:poly(ADP-ribose) glycohydrolase isoform X2 [Cylas formicarius]|nr:poly(ADP-ribose) glycohydrolase isoform X2 [Cylas formicarius]XP_060525029.1 poly(ADP-ribose) glycohydrolase isoform X2 [Cylas formicarius]
MENASNSKTWNGSSIEEICKGKGRWSFAVSPITVSKYHCVLYDVATVNLKDPPKPHCNFQPKHWDDDHVRMPYSRSNLFPVKEGNTETAKSRWKLITDSLSKTITSAEQLENSIHSYNVNLPRFSALHYFFYEVCSEDERDLFFSSLLPKIITLALSLSEIVPGSLPILKQNYNRSVSLSQLQIGCLLANAFLCTFPWKKRDPTSPGVPGVNFIRLFSANDRLERQKCVAEKIRCLCNYFKRITEKEPVGVITFERKFIPRSEMPRWDTAENNLGNTKIHICSTGTIENDGLGFLQVDFANKNIGGGVLGYGCVQEEIRFVICPELIVSRLFVEQLGSGEAVIITGAERYNDYLGYGDTFVWSKNIIDDVPFDIYGRRRTSICVIDATRFHKPQDQFHSSLILKELNKAYVGFSSREKENLAPVATGNWGCGAFRGSKKLKTLIQLMACTAAGRDLVYYSFGDEELREDFSNMYLFLAANKISIGQLWRFLCQFSTKSLKEEQLYSFIQQSYFDVKKQPSIKSFLIKSDKLKSNMPSSIEKSKWSPKVNSGSFKARSPKKCKREEEAMEIVDESSSSEDIIPSSQPSQEKYKKIIKAKPRISPSDVMTDITQLFDILDGNANRNLDKMDEAGSLLSELDKYKRNSGKLETKLTAKVDGLEEVIVIKNEEPIEKVDNVTRENSLIELKNKKEKKITDYFITNNKP